MEWKPINTIPKDGTRVLLFDGAEIMFGSYTEGYRRVGEKRICDEHIRGEAQGYDGCSEEVSATHWMPLPEAPNIK